jgi:hypothetical protein
MGEGRAAIGCDDRIDGLCRVLKAVWLGCVALMLTLAAPNGAEPHAGNCRISNAAFTFKGDPQ